MPPHVDSYPFQEHSYRRSVSADEA